MKSKIPNLLALILLCPLLSLGFFFSHLPVAKASSLPYNPAYLISDKLFADTGSMSVKDIQDFLSAENSGIKNYVDTEACSPPTPPSSPTYPYTYSYNYYPHCGQPENAATIIYDAAQAYGVSPRVILATMQKEESLVTDPSPTQSAINTAMGYACPSTCNPSYQGFFLQVDNGTWQLRTDVQLINGQNWWGESPSDYLCKSGHDVDPTNNTYSTGLYTGRTVTFYDQGGTAQTITLANAPTAALYCYTPFVGPISVTGYSGSYNFVQSFEQWWGSVSSPCYNDYNISGATPGEHVLPTKLGINHTDNLSLVQLNNTGTACAEDYTWQNGFYTQWRSLIASGTPAIDPSVSSIVSADTNGDGVDELYKVDYTGTGSGKIEIHGLSANLQGYTSHIATISPNISHSDADVIACDPAGYGRDNFFLVQYRNTTTGNVEIHEWSQNLQQWVNHWDTHYTAIDPKTAQIVCGDRNGDGKDEFYLVQYNSTGSGMLEVHGGITNLPYVTPWPYSNPAAWPVHSATISGPRIHWETDTASSADDADLIFADEVGNGVDRPYIIQYHGTASGRVEIYEMSNDFKRWVMLTTTNQGSY